MKAFNLFLVIVIGAASFSACSSTDGNSAANNANKPNDLRAQPETSASPGTPSATPGRQFTEADIAKLKWLEGSWFGMDGDKPFFERIHFEGTTMVVETMADGSFATVQDTSRFELKDGEFGNTVGDSRSAASTITDTAVQFVPAPIRQPDGTYSSTVKGNMFRFEKNADGTWDAILDTPAMKEKPAATKTYAMKPWKPGVSKAPTPIASNKPVDSPSNIPMKTPATNTATTPAR